MGTRVKLYELLETLIDLDNLIVNIAIKDRKFTEFVMVSCNFFLKFLFFFRRTTRNMMGIARC